MRIHKTLCIVAAVLCLQAPSRADEELEAGVDRLAKPLIDSGTVVGMSVGVVRGDTRLFIGYGRTDTDGGARPDEKTIYEIGSISKVFTAVLLADLAERKLLSIDDPLSAHLPKSVKAPSRGDEPIRMWHLSSHLSALPVLPDNFDPADPMNPYVDYTVKRMYDFLSNYKLPRKPGELYEYSNYAVGLLGHVLELKARKPYDKLLVERICEPLKMPDTRVTLTPSMRKAMAKPYHGEGSPSHIWDLGVLAGAGGIRSNTQDMLKFIEANFDDADTPLAAAFRMTHKKRHTTPDGIGVGLGWHIARDNMTLVHSGMTGGYHSYAAVSPKHKLGVIILSNTATDSVSAFGEQVIRLAYGIQDDEPLTFAEPIKIDPKLLPRYVGYFSIVPEFGLDVTLEGDQLMVQATGQEKYPVYPESDTVFFYKVVAAKITFHVDDDGKVNRLTLHQGGRDMDAKRREK